MIHVKKHLCPANHACPTLRVCPTGAIEQSNNGVPTVDQDKCIDCCKCIRSCPAFVGEGRCAEPQLRTRWR